MEVTNMSECNANGSGWWNVAGERQLHGAVQCTGVGLNVSRKLMLNSFDVRDSDLLPLRILMQLFRPFVTDTGESV